jgi:anti-sigma-K factor RskA
MNCEECEELLGAYALDALPDDERSAVQAHLTTCPEHAAKASELRAVAALLHDAAEPMTPPAGLRDRVTGAIAATPQRSQPSSLADYQSVRAPQAASKPGARWPVQYGWGAIAAALLIAVAGLLAWNINLQSNGGSSPDVLAVRPLTQDTGATAGYVVLFADDDVAVVGESLPRLDAAQVYQLWALSSEGEATSLGLMEYDDKGVPTANVSFGGGDVTAVAITIEPAGGSEQPTSAPLYTART